MAVSRGVSQPDRASEAAPDLFGEEEASSTLAKSNGVHSDDDNDLFSGQEMCFINCFSSFDPNKSQCDCTGKKSAEMVLFSLVMRVFVCADNKSTCHRFYTSFYES